MNPIREQGMKPTIVQDDGITLVIGQCSHDSEQTSIGPTTDQINHWCPDCQSSWTTWPDRNGAPVNSGDKTNGN